MTKCEIDPTCTFWLKDQCLRPKIEERACLKCGREVVQVLQKENEIIKEALRFIASQKDLTGNWAVERAKAALKEIMENEHGCSW